MATNTTKATLLLVALLLVSSSFVEAKSRKNIKKKSPPPRSTGPQPTPTPSPTPAPTPSPATPTRSTPAGKPNFVVILVDDQDYLLNSTHRAFMPKLHRYIGDRGLHLPQFIVTSSLCCPSRVNLLTGRFTHNHNVTSNQNPTGGWQKFQKLGLDKAWLPTWLKPLGYNTYFTGKFINLFDVAPGDTGNCPKGWDMFDPLTDKSVYDYTDFEFTPQCAKKDSFSNAYQTDVIQDRALRYIDDAVAKDQPFYLQVNPAACHTACPKGSEAEGGSCKPPVPSPKYEGRFAGAKVPRTSNWKVDLPATLGIGGDDFNEKVVDQHYQKRLETMLSIDDLIEAVVNKLDSAGVLDNTYIMYVSDNGYHLGNHGLPKGKTLPYEEDIRVPFYMRGPGIPEGTISPYMATMVDVTATLVALGGGEVPEVMDGIPLPLDRITGRTTEGGTLRQMLPVEMWINSLNNRIDKSDYRSVRICTNTTVFGGRPSTCWKYTIWCVFPSVQDYTELFDLGDDAGEINNLMSSVASNPELARLVGRLDALLQLMGYCKGPSCRSPWARLHPVGGVDSLEAAMDPQYDGKYEAYTKFKWRACSSSYNPVENEIADPRLGGVSRWVG